MHIRRVNTEIQTAIAKLPVPEKKALADWLLAQADGSLSVAPETLAEMAADPQMQAELRRIEEEFTVTETDGLARQE